jgi:hypothetical protein
MIAKLKFIRAFIIPIGFVVMGIYLVQKEDKMAVLIGYVNIFFWSALLLFAGYKLAAKNKP